jgi:uncharacterized protein with HEPN domain
MGDPFGFPNSKLSMVRNYVPKILIGEAASKLGRPFQETHPSIPWAQIIAMRNILVHEYFGMDLEAVWQVVERDLPELKAKLEAILKE